MTAIVAIGGLFVRRRNAWMIATIATALGNTFVTAGTQFGREPLATLTSATPALIAALGLVIVGAMMRVNPS